MDFPAHPRPVLAPCPAGATANAPYALCLPARLVRAMLPAGAYCDLRCSNTTCNRHPQTPKLYSASCDPKCDAVFGRLLVAGCISCLARCCLDIATLQPCGSSLLNRSLCAAFVFGHAQRMGTGEESNGARLVFPPFLFSPFPPHSILMSLTQGRPASAKTRPISATWLCLLLLCEPACWNRFVGGFAAAPYFRCRAPLNRNVTPRKQQSTPAGGFYGMKNVDGTDGQRQRLTSTPTPGASSPDSGEIHSDAKTKDSISSWEWGTLPSPGKRKRRKSTKKDAKAAPLQLASVWASSDDDGEQAQADENTDDADDADVESGTDGTLPVPKYFAFCAHSVGVVLRPRCSGLWGHFHAQVCSSMPTMPIL